MSLSIFVSVKWDYPSLILPEKERKSLSVGCGSMFLIYQGWNPAPWAC